ncbi:hypothetical protein [uncultured Sulfitobacter sp.]|uniref:hypothetical protein n=1 Tax=uncultured Sulfitobacter sp. TaxID=191468 RepID=UPI00260FECCD|nr:hypothetical protein [uncultured Sulfitobacter sp.]
MPDSDTPQAIRDLEKLISADAMKDACSEPRMIAQSQLVLAAKLLESAGYELAQTKSASHSVTMLAISAYVTQIAKTV